LLSSESLPASAESGGANEEVDRRSGDSSCAALIVQLSGFFVVREVERDLLKGSELVPYMKLASSRRPESNS
jgi:hypothetical protein